MDVDKLFKLPSLPSAAVNKRKWSAPKPDDSPAPPPTTSADLAEPGPSRPTKTARVDSGSDEDPSGPADEDETYFFSDDDQEDGRFFGGGLTAEQNQILDIMDSGDPSSSSTSAPSDIPSLRKQLLRFEKAINKNAEMRTKYASNPVKFIDSEADLNTELKSLLVLTTQPALFYPEFIKLGGAGSLVGLLSHENADIAAGAIEVIEELTDDDVLDAENLDEEEEGQGAGAGAMMEELVQALVKDSVLDLLVSNLGRFKDWLDEGLGAEERASKAVEVEGDAQAIYHTLGAIENIVSSRSALSEQLVASTSFLPWTLNRLAAKRAVDQNTSYTAELLAILLQNSPPNRAALGATEVAGENGIDILLSVLARYRRQSPQGAEEEEFVENIFDSLCLSLFEPHNKDLFLSGEGVELMVLLMKEKKSFGRVRAVKVLDHATSGPAGSKACLRIVEAGGLASLFSISMDCNTSKKGRTAVKLSDAEHILGIFCSLLTHLPSESTERIRLLTKFVADEYSALDHLMDLRDTLVAKLESVLPTQEEEEDEEEVYLAKLEQGLFSLQLLDTVVGWVVMEDDAVKEHVGRLLRRKGGSWGDVVATLKEYRDNIGDQVSIDGDDAGALKTKDILSALITYLEAL